jgi:hypothetical protein
MADYLTTALSGLGTTTNETPWGTAGQVLLEQSPRLVNTTKFDSGNLATAFGAALLGGLIKYKGRQDAAEQSAEATALAQQIQGAKTPEEQLALAQSAESSNVRNKLTNLVNALQIQKTANEQELAQKRAGSLLEIEAQLSPLGRELMKVKQQNRLAEIAAMTDAYAARKEIAADTKEPKALPSGVQERIVSATEFANNAKAHREQIAKMDPKTLKFLLTTDSSVFGTVGPPGFVSQNEGVLQEYRKAQFGATLTGREEKAADIIAGKNLTASKQDILAAWDYLIEANANRAKRTIDLATKGPAATLELLNASPETKTTETDAQKRNRELKAELAAIKAQIAGSR